MTTGAGADTFDYYNWTFQERQLGRAGNVQSELYTINHAKPGEMGL